MKRYLLSTVTMAVLVGFAGCGGSSSGSSADNGGGGGHGNGQVVIDNTQKAKNSFAVVGNAFEAGDAVNNIDPADFSSTNPLVRALTDVTSGTRNCALDGNVTYKVQKDSATVPETTKITLDFSQCSQEANQVYDGTITFTSRLNKEIKLHGFEIREDSDITRYPDMTILVHQLGDNVKMKLDGEVTKAKANTEMQHRLTLTDFVIDKDAANTLAIDGHITLTSNPTTCADGTYDVNTTERLVLSNEDPIDGTVIINGVAYQFQSDGKVTATINGQPVTFDPDQVDDINCSALPQ